MSMKPEHPSVGGSSMPGMQAPRRVERAMPDVTPGPMNARSGTSIVFEHEGIQDGEGAPGVYDPWVVLGLKPGATPHDLRVRYHELMEQYHPDYVKDGGKGDIQKFAEVDRAYQLIIKSPTLDKRYKNLVSDTQYFYYRFLPQWMAKNVDEAPRWWSWLRWRVPSVYVVFMCVVGAYAIARVSAKYPMIGMVMGVSLVMDWLLHTMMAPIAFMCLLLKAFVSGQTYNLSWFHSPKGFLRRWLDY
jgi:hypothetical protein